MLDRRGLRIAWARLLAAALPACLVVPRSSAAPQASQSAPGSQSSPTASQPSSAPARVLTSDDFPGLSWRSIGPANMGGRVADVCFAPGNARTFYVAFATGGLFKTTNGGMTYAPVFDKYETSSIGAVVVCDAPENWAGWEAEDAGAMTQPSAAARPATPDELRGSRGERGKAKIVWVGTGEGNGRNSSSYGHGVYRSTDGGANFTSLGLTDSHDIPRLAVDPRDPDVCYVAALGRLWGPNAERGVYKTTDGGKTWTPVLQIDENTGAIDVVLDPKTPDTVYAAMYMRRRTAYSFQSGGPQGGIYRSDDSGTTWRKLAGGLPSQTGRIGLDVYQADPRVVYAVIESDEGGHTYDAFNDRSKAGGVFRSEDRGETWLRVQNYAPRAFYFSKIRVDPTDDQRVYLLGWTLYISDDGGRTFRSNGASKPHVDMHALAIDVEDRDHLLMGTDGGVYVSRDRAETWDFHNHIAAGQFYNIALDLADPYHVGGGLQDNGTWYGPSRTRFGEICNHDWISLNGGDGFHVAFDPTDANIVYSESQGGELTRLHMDTGFRRYLKPTPKEGQPRFRFNWNSPFLISAHEPTTLYFGGNCVFKLTQRGDRWEKISDDLTTRDVRRLDTVGSEAETHCTIVSLAESPLARGTLWAGTDDGLVQLTRDDGKHWANVTPPQAGGWYIARIEASHHDPDTAFVAIDGHRSNEFNPHVVMTRDAGKSWQDITGSLPGGAHVKVVRQDRFTPNVLYAGTERGLFVSVDLGRNWARLNGSSLPTVPIDDIQQHPRERDLVVGTHGRSIYVLDDAAPLSQLTSEVLESPFYVFELRDATPRYALGRDGFWSERFYSAPNPPIGARLDYWIRDKDGGSVEITIENPQGVRIRALSGAAGAGVNRVLWDLQQEHKLSDPREGLGMTQWVAPGAYTVKFRYGKHTAQRKLIVHAAPGHQPGL